MSSTQTPHLQRAKISFFQVTSRFRTDPFGLMSELQKNYGDFIAIPTLPGLDQYAVFDPALVHEILVERPDEFEKPELGKRLLRTSFGNGLFFSEGDFWKRQRKLAQPAFHHMRIKNYAEDMARETEKLIDGWTAGSTVEIDKAMRALTLIIVVNALFKTDVSGLTTEIGEAMAMLGGAVEAQVMSMVHFLMPEWVPTSVNRAKKESVERLNRILYKLIAERRKADSDSGDLLSMFLQAKDAETGEAMSDLQAHDELMTMFIAGHETSASALSWAFVELVRHPDAAAKLHDEVHRVLGSRRPTVDDLPDLSYTQQVIKEVLRMYPPALFIARDPLHDISIGDTTLKKGAVIQIMPYVLHHDARWFPEPDVFKPERWTPDFETSLPKSAYLPFGNGPRICIGNGFAMLEMQLVLAAIMNRCQFRLAPDAAPIDPRFSLTLGFKHPVRLVVEKS